MVYTFSGIQGSDGGYFDSSFEHYESDIAGGYEAGRLSTAGIMPSGISRFSGWTAAEASIATKERVQTARKHARRLEATFQTRRLEALAMPPPPPNTLSQPTATHEGQATASATDGASASTSDLVAAGGNNVERGGSVGGGGGFHCDMSSCRPLSVVSATTMLNGTPPPPPDAPKSPLGLGDGFLLPVVESGAAKWGVLCVALEVVAQLLGIDALVEVRSKQDRSAPAATLELDSDDAAEASSSDEEEGRLGGAKDDDEDWDSDRFLTDDDY